MKNKPKRIQRKKTKDWKKDFANSAIRPQDYAYKTHPDRLSSLTEKEILQDIKDCELEIKELELKIEGITAFVPSILDGIDRWKGLIKVLKKKLQESN